MMGPFNVLALLGLPGYSRTLRVCYRCQKFIRVGEGTTFIAGKGQIHGRCTDAAKAKADQEKAAERERGKEPPLG